MESLMRPLVFLGDLFCHPYNLKRLK